MLNKIYKNRKKNRGSSLVFVLIAIAFVSILTAVIVSAAATNYRLKVMNNYSKKTFYNAETALKEVYAGLGKVACDTLESNYLEVAQNLTKREEVGGVILPIKKTNEEANKQLRQNFYEDLYNIVYIKDSTGELCDYLSNFLTNPANAYVSDYGAIDYSAENCSIVINDVVVAYKEQDLDYFSTVAVDMELKYPNNEFDFISNTKSSLETFLDYAIIAMEGVSIGKDAYSSHGRIAGGVFAGYNATASNTTSIVIQNGSTLKVGNSGNDLKSNIVSTGNVVTYGNLIVEDGEVWCVNMNAGDEMSGGANITFHDGSKLFVADDLNIEGNACNITLGSEFFGFGYNKDADPKGKLSSAIVVNGRQTNITATNLKRFVIGGRAYLDLGNTDTAGFYVTGDSLSLRGVQEIYLVPVFYMDKRAGVSDPTTEITNPSSDINLDVKLNDFFAIDLLNSENKYMTKNVKGVFYYYLNFKDAEAQKTYINCILSDAAFNAYIASASNPGNSERYETDLKELRQIVSDNMDKFILGGEIQLGFNAEAKIFAEGNLYRVDEDNGVTSALVTMVHSDANNMILDKQNRYAVMRSFLYDIGIDGNDTACAVRPDDIYIDGNKYSTGDLEKTPYDRFIDIDELQKTTQNYYNKRVDGTIAAVFVSESANFNSNVTVPSEVIGATDGVVNIPADVVGGVVLAYNLDVVVQSSFEGLIITNGKVYTRTATNDLITNGIRDVASRILDEDVIIAKYFYAYQMESVSDRESSIVDVADILSFNNWRKNYAK